MGTVTDPSGAVVVGAKLEVTDVATNVTLNSVTNGSGYFEVDDLVPGTYKVAATAPGNVVAVGDAGTILTFTGGGWLAAKSGVDVTLRDVIVDPGVWVAGDKGTLLTGSGVASAPFRKIDLGTTCDLVSLFPRGNDIWVVGKGAIGGGVWRVRAADGVVVQHFGGC